MKTFWKIMVLITLMSGGCGKLSGPLLPDDKLGVPTDIINSPSVHWGHFRIYAPQAIKSKDTGQTYISYLSTDTIRCASDTPSAPENARNTQWAVTGNNIWSSSADPLIRIETNFGFSPVHPVIADFDDFHDSGMGLNFKITATNSDPITYHDTQSVDIEIAQDNIDDLRQEYIDVYNTNRVTVDEWTVPRYNDFDQTIPNKNLKSGNCARHHWFILRQLSQRVDEICSYLQEPWESTLGDSIPGIDLSITSGYRCPVHNAKAGGASHSEHMFGLAFDWDYGNNDDVGSQMLYEIYKRIGELYPTNSVIILYEPAPLPGNPNHKNQYFFPADAKGDGDFVIPDSYDVTDSDVRFTHGHTDFRKGW